MKKEKVYIGVEIKVREFDAKLFLAGVAAEAGYEVILGQQKLLKRRLEDLPPGIYLDKSVAASKAARHRRLQRLGFAVVAQDEEGLAFYNVEEYLKRRISAETLSLVDYFFAWGSEQQQVVTQKASNRADRIVAVGHPRIDLTRKELRAFYDADVQRVHDRYGSFILINTNFSLCNHALGKDVALDVLAKGGKIADEAHRKYYTELRAYKQRLFDHFTEMIIRIKRQFPAINIIVRPHPVENHDYWRHILPDEPTIHVVHEGNILPWLLAADVMIHNS
ncbi:hypothetical protein GF339_16445, partial [candidate division KSB3 bacterium]|nr:hypothetical protein [candidate division KSB3 bacterium]MBD3326178.1 hypothetical protein [candidate division KSB3 bacterium]